MHRLQHPQLLSPAKLQPRGVPKIEKLAVKALSSLDGNQSGRYYALKSMKEAEHQQLIEDHFLFNKLKTAFKELLSSFPPILIFAFFSLCVHQVLVICDHILLL